MAKMKTTSVLGNENVRIDSGMQSTKNENKRKKKNKKTKNYIPIAPPKMRNLEKGNISSNWKSLMSSIAPPSAASHTKHKPVTKAEPVMPRKAELKSNANDEIWFDDVDETLLDLQPGATTTATSAVEASLVKEKSFSGLTRIIGMDCEMVGVGAGGTDSILARVSIVNHFGHTVYDTFVAPREPVTDYRTHVSGVRVEDLRGAPDFRTVQERVSEILTGRILVGHALKHDMRVLFLNHPKRLLRDTSAYKPFRAAFGGRTPSLKNLSARFLGVSVQTGEHSSVQDAQAAVRLYTMVRKEWESALAAKRAGSRNKPKSKKGGGERVQLNNKSSLLAGVQQQLADTGTRRYVDSDSD